MLRRGTLRPHGNDKEGQEGPTEEKPVFNRGKWREHDDEWEEPLLKWIKHLKEMTMRAEAARAGKRFKHAVTALSVMSYELGQRHFYKTLAAMTDGQLLAALEAGSIELSISGAPPAAHQPIPPAPQSTSQYPATPSRSPEVQQAQPTALPSRQKKEAFPLQAVQPDRHLGWGDNSGPAKGQTAKHSWGPAARNSREQTSQQRKRLKRNCPRPHRFSQPMRRRHASQERRLLIAIGRESSGRGSSQRHRCTALA
jgi:hypothetical protein